MLGRLKDKSYNGSEYSLTTFTRTIRDNVEWDEEQEEAARRAIEKQERAPIPTEEQGKLANATYSRW